MSAAPAVNQIRGIAALVIAGAVLSLTDSLAKLLTGTYPVGEILFFRSLFVFIPVFFMVSRSGGIGSLRINNWKGQLSRGVCVLFTTFGFVMAIRVMPLADVIAIFFVSPIFATAMAPFLLGEKVGWRRWTAVVVGFSGVLFMIKPGSNPLVWIAVFALAAAFTNSLRDIITRRLSTTETNNSIMFCSTAFVLLGGLVTLPFDWKTPDLYGIGLLALTGTLQGVGQYFLVIAFRFGEVGVLAPFRYFNLVWAVIYGFLF
ncbi:MAG: Riboflavin transporter, partial [Alphaproteobacteria bacterium MarineAlpha4_Bin2]